jgi:hypothetical protein
VGSVLMQKRTSIGITEQSLGATKLVVVNLWQGMLSNPVGDWKLENVYLQHKPFVIHTAAESDSSWWTQI